MRYLLPMTEYRKYRAILLVSCLPSVTLAAEEPMKLLDLTEHWAGFSALLIFAIAYLLAMIEEVTELTDGICRQHYLDANRGGLYESRHD